jgi:competence ComEA-like helix-hairpin-helix protein
MKSHIVPRVACIIFTGVLLLALGANVKAQEKKEGLKGKTVNINTASAEDLAKNVPLITPELAKKIVEYRKETGDFQVLEELLQVDGFTRELLQKVKPFLLLEGLGGDECTC